jgi:hypothetical protein
MGESLRDSITDWELDSGAAIVEYRDVHSLRIFPRA